MKSVNLLSVWILLLFLGTVVHLRAQTYTVNNVPNPKTRGDYWVSNPDGIISMEAQRILEDKLSTIKGLTTKEVAVVLLKSIGSASPADFATDLFNKWGIGTKSSNNGLLILLVKDQRRVEFRTGYGLEAELTDAQCYQIQQQYMVPNFKANDFDLGLISGVDAVAKIIVGNNWDNTLTINEEEKIKAFLGAAFLKSFQENKQAIFDKAGYFTNKSTLDSLELWAKQFKSKIGVDFRLLFLAGSEGISLSKYSNYLRNLLLTKDAKGQKNKLLFLVISLEPADWYYYYQLGEHAAVEQEHIDYMMSRLDSSWAKPSWDQCLKMAMNTFEQCWTDSAYNALTLHQQQIINAQKQELLEEDLNQDYNEQETSFWENTGPFWMGLLHFYLWGLGMLMLGTFIFVGIAQIIPDPYSKHNLLGFFALNVWMYIFPLPYLFVGRYIDRLRSAYRDAPRFSKKTGEPLYKLSEEEEDKYLKAGNIVEEKINSIHYDVWTNEDHSDLLILPYPIWFSQYNRCPKCKFKTYYLEYNRTIRSATTSSSGLGEKSYSCKNCKHRHRYTYVIPQISESSSSSSSGGGSSFGGGSSGGGGAGSSW